MYIFLKERPCTLSNQRKEHNVVQELPMHDVDHAGNGCNSYSFNVLQHSISKELFCLKNNLYHSQISATADIGECTDGSAGVL